MAFFGFLVICLFAVFTPGGAWAGTHGVVFAAGGLLLVCLPPRYRVSRWIAILAFLLVVTAFLAFLPLQIFGALDWRQELDALGLDTGSLVTAHPSQTLELVLMWSFSILLCLALLGHRMQVGTRNAIAAVFVIGVGVYALVSMLVQTNDWNWAWDPDPAFGLFPNRNHTATLLVMGTLAGLGVLHESLKQQKWIIVGLVGISVGLSTWAVLGISESRAGGLLLGLGFCVWLLGMGRSYLRGRVLVSILVLGGLAGFLFLISDTSVKTRIGETVEQMGVGEDQAIGELDAREGNGGDTPMDFRVLIYRDTMSMISERPVTGFGKGMFPYVFQQYRNHSANNKLPVHPESDWLKMAAESGIISALLLLTLAVLLFSDVMRRAQNRRSWPLNLALLIAAAVVPVHGIFDVPGHRIGLGLSAVLLLALATRKSKKDRALGMMGQLGFRIGGLCVLLFGFYLIRSEWLGGAPSANRSAVVAAQEIRDLHAADAAEQLEASEMSAGGEPVVASGEDKIERSLQVSAEAIEVTPLDPELHFLRGASALYFDDKNEVVEQSFAIQRRLDPTWVNLPLRQAKAWILIDPNQTLSLWGDALNRAREMADKSQGNASRLSARLASGAQPGERPPAIVWTSP